jgi:zona occludens toxin
MIELITGSPGAGKTTFAVATRLREEAKRDITMEGGEVVRRRLVCAGFRGLKVEHEQLPHKLTGQVTADEEVAKWNQISDGDQPAHQRLPGDPVRDVPACVQNWWLWCKPGDLICVDEAQFIAPRGTLGRKPPYWIQALEIHRHYGVDFLLITQHPQLIDTTIRALVGLHRHVRSVLGSPMCMVYVWDHASNPERFNLANKSTFFRRPSHYRLFHSSVAHVKPPSGGRAIVVIVPALICALVVGVWVFKQRFTPEGVAKATGGALAIAPASGVGGTPAKAPVRAAGAFGPLPVVRGCVARGDVCRCVGDGGEPLLLDRDSCGRSASGFTGLVAWAPREVFTPPAPSAPAPLASASAPAGSLFGAASQ